MASFCPKCSQRNIQSLIKTYCMDTERKFRLCANENCMYPIGYYGKILIHEPDSDQSKIAEYSNYYNVFDMVLKFLAGKITCSDKVIVLKCIINTINDINKSIEEICSNFSDCEIKSLENIFIQMIQKRKNETWISNYIAQYTDLISNIMIKNVEFGTKQCDIFQKMTPVEINVQNVENYSKYIIHDNISLEENTFKCLLAHLMEVVTIQEIKYNVYGSMMFQMCSKFYKFIGEINSFEYYLEHGTQAESEFLNCVDNFKMPIDICDYEEFIEKNIAEIAIESNMSNIIQEKIPICGSNLPDNFKILLEQHKKNSDSIINILDTQTEKLPQIAEKETVSDDLSTNNLQNLLAESKNQVILNPANNEHIRINSNPPCSFSDCNKDVTISPGEKISVPGSEAVFAISLSENSISNVVKIQETRKIVPSNINKTVVPFTVLATQANMHKSGNNESTSPLGDKVKNERCIKKCIQLNKIENINIGQEDKLSKMLNQSNIKTKDQDKIQLSTCLNKTISKQKLLHIPCVGLNKNSTKNTTKIQKIVVNSNVGINKFKAKSLPEATLELDHINCKSNAVNIVICNEDTTNLSKLKVRKPSMKSLKAPRQPAKLNNMQHDNIDKLLKNTKKYINGLSKVKKKCKVSKFVRSLTEDCSEEEDGDLEEALGDNTKELKKISTELGNDSKVISIPHPKEEIKKETESVLLTPTADQSIIDDNWLMSLLV